MPTASVNGAALQLLLLKSVSDAGVSLLNKGNARTSALATKVDKCTKALLDKNQARRVSRSIEIGTVAISFTAKEGECFGGVGSRLLESTSGLPSNCFVVDSYEDTQKILHEAFRCVGIGNNPDDLSMEKFFNAALNWWGTVTSSWGVGQLVEWIQTYSKKDNSELWIPGDYDSVDALIEDQTRNPNKACLIHFILINFARITRVACIVP